MAVGDDENIGLGGINGWAPVNGFSAENEDRLGGWDTQFFVDVPRSVPRTLTLGFDY